MRNTQQNTVNDTQMFQFAGRFKNIYWTKNIPQKLVKTREKQTIEMKYTKKWRTES